MLLERIETFMASLGIRKIWGEVSNDPDLYEEDFPILEDYIENIQTFYTMHGWSFTHYGIIDPENPHIIGKVEKVLTAEKQLSS